MSLNTLFKLLWILALAPELASADLAGEMLFRLSGAEGGRLLGEATITNPGPDKLKLTANDTARRESLGVSYSPSPIDLWVLVDASQMCIAQKVEAYLAGLVSELKAELPARSTVTLASYKNPAVLVNQKRTRVGDLEVPSIACDPKVMSASYESALLALLDTQGTSSEMPTRVWVLTSGNVQLSELAARRIKAAGISVHVLLYNPILRAEIGGAVRAQSARMGGDRFLFSTVNTESPGLPEVNYRVEIESPRAPVGSQVALEMLAASKHGLHARTLAALTVPAGAQVGWFRRHAIWIWSLVVLLVLSGAAWKLSRIYRARYCPKCRRMQRAEDARCPFCVGDEDAYLVGAFNLRDRRKKDRPDVLLLNAESTEIGTQRRHRVRLPETRGRKQAFAAIVRERAGQGRLAYRVIARVEGAEVSVNGKNIRGARYLAPGDLISVNGTEMTFLTRRLVNQLEQDKGVAQ